MKKILTALTVAAAVLSSQAALITDSEMTALTAVANETEYGEIDSGWTQRKADDPAQAWHTTVYDSRSVIEKGSANDDYAINQIATVSDSGTEIKVSIVYYATSLTDFRLSLYGWTGSTAGMAAGDTLSADTRYDTPMLNDTNSLVAVDLLDGTFSGGNTASAMTIATVANAWTTNTFAIDLSSYSEIGVDNVDDLALIGINIGRNDGLAEDEIRFDSVTVIPEPATLGLFGLGALMALAIRRQCV